MTPYRGPRMRQVSSQWEWEEEKEQQRVEEIRAHKLTLRRDYCWHRVGLRWEVRLSWLDTEGHALYTERVVDRLFWRQKTAARVSNAIFDAYNDGRSMQRQSGPFVPCPGCDGHECDDGCNYPGALSHLSHVLGPTSPDAATPSQRRPE